MDSLKVMHGRVIELESEVIRLREALVRARSDMRDWGAYASDYFQEKWGLADDLAAIDAVLATGPMV